MAAFIQELKVTRELNPTAVGASGTEKNQGREGGEARGCGNCADFESGASGKIVVFRNKMCLFPPQSVGNSMYTFETCDIATQ